MLDNLEPTMIFQKVSNWLEKEVYCLFVDVTNFSKVPSDYVAIKLL